MSYSEQISNDDQQFEFTARISYERFYSENTSWGVYSFNTTDQLPNCQKITAKMFFSAVETDGVDNVGIAVPRREGCLNSAYELNKDIADVLLKDENKSISFGEKEFKLG